MVIFEFSIIFNTIIKYEYEYGNMNINMILIPLLEKDVIGYSNINIYEYSYILLYIYIYFIPVLRNEEVIILYQEIACVFYYDDRIRVSLIFFCYIYHKISLYIPSYEIYISLR